MSLQDPFGFGMNPGPWLATHDETTEDAGNPVQVGMANNLAGDPGDPNDNPADEVNTTLVMNKAPQNAAFAAQNIVPTGPGVGIVGESFGGFGSVGVLGTSTFWGAAGIQGDSPTPFDLSDTAVFEPTGAGVSGIGDHTGVFGLGEKGVFGLGDSIGVRGISRNAGGLGPGVHGGSAGIGVLGTSDASLAKNSPDDLSQTGVMGIGSRRGGVFQTSPRGEASTFANIQLSPVALKRDFHATVV